MSQTKSKFKCVVEKGAIPMSRLIGKSKLEQLKANFNSGMNTKTTKRNLNNLSAMATIKQKESYARGEKAREQARLKKEATKAEISTK